MKNKFTFVTMLAMMFVFAMMLVSSAAVSVVLNAPANYSNHTTSFTYNCTTSAHAVRNVTVYANSSSGTMNALQVFTNTSAAQTAWSGTVSIQAADDGTNQNISCYANNGTGQAYSAEIASTHVMLDSTAPTCSILKDHNTIPYKGTETLTWQSADAIERVSTAVDVDGPEDQTTLSYTDQGRVLTLTSQDTKYVGTWTASMTVTDRAGNTCTDSVTFKSYMPDGTGEYEADTGTQTNKKGLLIIALVIIGIIYFGSKKK